jgi:GNAT superfamily N-acetyltransferase
MAWDEVAGYAELDRTCVENVEIVFFGLMPEFIGKGLGSYLLTAVVEHAWDVGAERVWLHTCTLDHPAALPNYLARGFRLFRTEQSFEEMDITVTSARTLERKL